MAGGFEDAHGVVDKRELAAQAIQVVVTFSSEQTDRKDEAAKELPYGANLTLTKRSRHQLCASERVPLTDVETPRRKRTRRAQMSTNDQQRLDQWASPSRGARAGSTQLTVAC